MSQGRTSVRPTRGKPIHDRVWSALARRSPKGGGGKRAGNPQSIPQGVRVSAREIRRIRNDSGRNVSPAADPIRENPH